MGEGGHDHIHAIGTTRWGGTRREALRSRGAHPDAVIG